MITSGGALRERGTGATHPFLAPAGRSCPLTYNRIAIAILIVALLCAWWLGDGGIAAW